MSDRVPFNRPVPVGAEFENIRESIESGRVSGDGLFTRRCHELLSAEYDAKVLLTHSCTAALEMSAILADVGPGDEVVMPSYTFVSTANAVVLRGATPVFVDVDPGTLNIDPDAVQAAIGPATKAIMVVHYAGVGCDMGRIGELCESSGATLIEDAAQAYGACWDGRRLGTFGALAALSFHETKNIISGEGGALIINDPALVERAEILREKGTNRTQFHRGTADKYTWLDIGSSYLPSDIIAAFLFAQLGAAAEITRERLCAWARYHQAFEELEAGGRLRRPTIPARAEHNGHIYYVLLPDAAARAGVIAGLAERGVVAPFHYVPLHSSPAGLRYGRVAGSMAVTDDLSARLIRLPLYPGVEREQDEVIAALRDVLGGGG